MEKTEKQKLEREHEEICDRLDQLNTRAFEIEQELSLIYLKNEKEIKSEEK